jgi:hypothetical protein
VGRNISCLIAASGEYTLPFPVGLSIEPIVKPLYDQTQTLSPNNSLLNENEYLKA